MSQLQGAFQSTLLNKGGAGGGSMGSGVGSGGASAAGSAAGSFSGAAGAAALGGAAGVGGGGSALDSLRARMAQGQQAMRGSDGGAQ